MAGHDDLEDAVSSVIDDFFRALDQGDMERIAALCAPDDRAIHVGTDRGERWVGWDALEASTREQLASLDVFRVTSRDRVIHLLEAGDVACFFQEMDVRAESDGKEERLHGARFTGVAERREGRWVLVQSHLSVPRGA